MSKLVKKSTIVIATTAFLAIPSTSFANDKNWVQLDMWTQLQKILTGGGKGKDPEDDKIELPSTGGGKGKDPEGDKAVVYGVATGGGKGKDPE